MTMVFGNSGPFKLVINFERASGEEAAWWGAFMSAAAIFLGMAAVSRVCFKRRPILIAIAFLFAGFFAFMLGLSVASREHNTRYFRERDEKKQDEQKAKHEKAPEPSR